MYEVGKKGGRRVHKSHRTITFSFQNTTKCITIYNAWNLITSLYTTLSQIVKLVDILAYDFKSIVKLVNNLANSWGGNPQNQSVYRHTQFHKLLKLHVMSGKQLLSYGSHTSITLIFFTISTKNWMWNIRWKKYIYRF